MQRAGGSPFRALTAFALAIDEGTRHLAGAASAGGANKLGGHPMPQPSLLSGVGSSRVSSSRRDSISQRCWGARAVENLSARAAVFALLSPRAADGLAANDGGAQLANRAPGRLPPV